MKFIYLILCVLYLDVVTAGLLDTLGDILANSNNPQNTNNRYPNNIHNNGLLAGLNGNIGERTQIPSILNLPNNNNNILNGIEHPMTEQEQKAVAEAFPEGVELLNRLKELNKLKDEGKLSTGQNNNSNKNPVTTSSTTQPPKRPVNEKPEGTDNGQSVKDHSKTTTENTNEVAVQDFFFQAQPVVPENERQNYKFPIYYVP